MEDGDADAGGRLYRIVYDSVVLLPFGLEGEQGVRDILAVARGHNASVGITGALYCDGAYFMQVLEGPRRAVETLFARIQADPRHGDLRIAERGAIGHRSFAGWHMAWVTEEAMLRTLARYPDMPEVRAYRAPELVAALLRVVTDEAR
jgi:hypothetical protein